VTFLIQGLMLGATYALVAMGLVIVYSVLRAFQFAHGALVMFASYLFLVVYRQTDGSLLLAVPAVVLGIAVLSVAICRVAFEPLLGRHFPSLITSLGIAIVIQQLVALYFYQGQAVAYPQALKLDGGVTVFGTLVSGNRLLVFGVAIVAIFLIDRFFAKTRVGMEMRAVADAPEGAQLVGVNLKRTLRLAFVIAGLAATVAGVLFGLLFSTISPGLGTELTIKGLAATLLGGSTSLRGAIVAGFIIGIAESLSVGYVSSGFSEAIAYLVILAILLVRPYGLFGRPELARA
jgi:branched-chain amino acid transport system permease protein